MSIGDTEVDFKEIYDAINGDGAHDLSGNPAIGMDYFYGKSFTDGTSTPASGPIGIGDMIGKTVETTDQTYPLQFHPPATTAGSGKTGTQINISNPNSSPIIKSINFSRTEAYFTSVTQIYDNTSIKFQSVKNPSNNTDNWMFGIGNGTFTRMTQAADPRSDVHSGFYLYDSGFVVFVSPNFSLNSVRSYTSNTLFEIRIIGGYCSFFIDGVLISPQDYPTANRWDNNQVDFSTPKYLMGTMYFEGSGVKNITVETLLYDWLKLDGIWVTANDGTNCGRAVEIGWFGGVHTYNLGITTGSSANGYAEQIQNIKDWLEEQNVIKGYTYYIGFSFNTSHPTSPMVCKRTNGPDGEISAVSGLSTQSHSSWDLYYISNVFEVPGGIGNPLRGKDVTDILRQTTAVDNILDGSTYVDMPAALSVVYRQPDDDTGYNSYYSDYNMVYQKRDSFYRSGGGYKYCGNDVYTGTGYNEMEIFVNTNNFYRSYQHSGQVYESDGTWNISYGSMTNYGVGTSYMPDIYDSNNPENDTTGGRENNDRRHLMGMTNQDLMNTYPNSYPGTWFQFELKDNYKLIPKTMSWTVGLNDSNSHLPKEFKLFGSNDGSVSTNPLPFGHSNWVDLPTSGSYSTPDSGFTFSTNVAYKYFRFAVNKTVGSSVLSFTNFKLGGEIIN